MSTVKAHDAREAAKILKAAIGRVPSTDEDRQEAVIRVVFAAKIAGLTDSAILRAFMGAWPHVSESNLRASVTWPKPKRTPKKKAKR